MFEAGRGRLTGASSGADYVPASLPATRAPRLGEVALVDGDSPVGRSGS